MKGTETHARSPPWLVGSASSRLFLPRSGGTAQQNINTTPTSNPTWHMAHVERLSKLFAASKRSNGPRFRRITTVSTTEHSEKKDSTTAVASTTQDDDHVGVASDDRDSRTVFVGNLPLSSNKKTVRKLFTQYGHIETIRFRSAARLLLGSYQWVWLADCTVS